MIFPKHITKTVGSGKNYLLQRQFGEEEWCIDRLHDTIETTSPFVIVSKGRNVLLTSRIIDAENTECEYVALTKKKPTRAAYNNNEIEVLSWIKHPQFCEDTPERIVDSWENKFSYRKETPQQSGLRQPQLAATHAYLANETEKQRKIIVMPTGTGKTETMLSILIAAQCRK